MELIDKIMSQISDYVTDPMAVSNCLYIAMQDYSILVYNTEGELNKELSTKTKQELMYEVIKNFRCLKQITEVVEEW